MVAARRGQRQPIQRNMLRARGRRWRAQQNAADESLSSVELGKRVPRHLAARDIDVFAIKCTHTHTHLLTALSHKVTLNRRSSISVISFYSDDGQVCQSDSVDRRKCNIYFLPHTCSVWFTVSRCLLNCPNANVLCVEDAQMYGRRSVVAAFAFIVHVCGWQARKMNEKKMK